MERKKDHRKKDKEYECEVTATTANKGTNRKGWGMEANKGKKQRT